MSRIELFGVSMDSLEMKETVHLIDRRLQHEQFTQHVVVNAAKIVNAQRDRELASSIQACDIINIDGMSVVWAARFMGFDVPQRVTGVDLFEELVRLAERRRYPIFLLGATDEVVKRTAAVLCERYRDLVLAGYHHGYFWNDEEAIVQRIKASGAKLLFVAITSPKKEKFINHWKDQLGIDFVMGVGGTFDVVSGMVKRAPLWMQRSGLEWLYRVSQEPRRLWKRYLLTNSLFLMMLVKAKLRVLKERS